MNTVDEERKRELIRLYGLQHWDQVQAQARGVRDPLIEKLDSLFGAPAYNRPQGSLFTGIGNLLNGMAAAQGGLQNMWQPVSNFTPYEPKSTFWERLQGFWNALWALEEVPWGTELESDKHSLSDVRMSTKQGEGNQ